MFWSDELSISREPREIIRHEPATLPGNTVVKDIEVERSYSDEGGVEYSLEFTSYDCADGFEKMSIDTSGLSGPAVGVVERQLAHSPTPRGTVRHYALRQGAEIRC